MPCFADTLYILSNAGGSAIRRWRARKQALLTLSAFQKPLFITFLPIAQESAIGAVAVHGRSSACDASRFPNREMGSRDGICPRPPATRPFRSLLRGIHNELGLDGALPRRPVELDSAGVPR